MSYRIAGIDVHKKMLAVVVADIAGGGELEFERRRFGANPEQLRMLAQWLVAEQVEEVVMESTAQYWRPVWDTLEQHWQPVRRSQPEASACCGALHLAQAKSNRGRRGRKNDFADAERLLKRLLAQELVLSLVPDPTQRLWRSLTRYRHQLTRELVRLHNQLEALLEQAHIKLSSVVSDLKGLSARRILKAIAAGETDAAKLAALADSRLKASPEQLCDALSASAELHPVYRGLIGSVLERMEMAERQIEQCDQDLAGCLKPQQPVVERLAAVPGLGVDSAHQILAEIGPSAETFASAKELASWIGVCPGENQSAEVSHSSRCPKGNRPLRRLLNQAAHAAVKMNGCIFQVKFQALLRRMEYQEAIWTIAHRLTTVIWIVLHRGVEYEERGPSVSAKARRHRTAKMIRELRRLGYRVEPVNPGALLA